MMQMMCEHRSAGCKLNARLAQAAEASYQLLSAICHEALEASSTGFDQSNTF